MPIDTLAIVSGYANTELESFDIDILPDFQIEDLELLEYEVLVILELSLTYVMCQQLGISDLSSPLLTQVEPPDPLHATFPKIELYLDASFSEQTTFEDDVPLEWEEFMAIINFHLSLLLAHIRSLLGV